MASNSGWTTNSPLGTDAVSSGDDNIRSFRTFMQNFWEAEHYLTDGSANSAGLHKQGAGRAFQAAATSALSNPVISGQLFHVTGDNSLWVSDPSNSTWTQVTNGLTTGSVNTWSALQVFSSGLSASALTVGGNVAITGTISAVSTPSLKVGGTTTLTLVGSGTTASWDPSGGGTLASLAFDNTPVDVSGATTGDIVISEQPFLADSYGLRIEGYVSASDVVTLVCQNAGGTGTGATARSVNLMVFRYT